MKLTKKTGTHPPVSMENGADREEIARLAYAYWEARGGNGGSAEDDWFRAEQEIRARNGSAYK